MALSAAERKRNQRAREKEERARLAALQPAKPTEEQIRSRLSQHVRDLEWAQEYDATGNFYKSECRTLVQLLAIYEGSNINEKETEDDEEETPYQKRKRKVEEKQRRPNPSVDKVTISATEFVDSGVSVLFDPGEWEYETLTGQKVDLRKLYEVDEVVSFRRWLDLRDKARKNLFWLCNLLDMRMFHKTHQMICDRFVQKNFDGLFFKNMKRSDIPAMLNKQVRLAEDGVTPTKTMMLFAPRGGRKSTIDGIDAVQWLLNCPDLNIMIATAFRDLAKQLFEEIKAYFFLAKGGEPTAFQILFPEYVTYGRDGGSDSDLKCPAALFKSKDPHLWKTSMESSKTGKRCHIRKLDDVVDDKNSANDELRESIVKKINSTNNLLAGGAFTDIVGTRYFTNDWYGTRMAKDKNGREPSPYSYLCIPAWAPKPQYRHLYNQLLKEEDGLYKVTEEMVDLWWPQSAAHNFQALQTLLKETKEISFKNQQLNIATDPKEVDLHIFHFDKDVLRAHQYDKSMMPKDMTIVQCWDISYSERKTSDYSAGATLGFYRNKNGEDCAVVIEVTAEKWKADELASNMLAFYEKYKPKRVYVEKVNGWEFLLGNIRNFAFRRGSDFANDNGPLRPFDIDNSKNAKENRIKNLEFLLAHDRLWFVSGHWIDLVFEQLSEYKGGKSTAYRKDDIPDCLAMGIVRFLPPSALQHNPDPRDIERERERELAASRREAIRDRMFGGMPRGYVTTAHQWGNNPTTPQQPPPAAPAAHAVRFPRGGSHAVLPNVMRGRPKG